MSLHRMIYSSRPFGFDSGMLNGILMDARRSNERDDITGALICRDDIYLQWLEGPKDQVTACVERIRRDDRHVDLHLLVTASATERVFSDWAMLHDPAASWIWSREAVAQGAHERASAQEVEGFFLQLREKHAVA
jgi:hypothetical protein